MADNIVVGAGDGKPASASDKSQPLDALPAVDSRDDTLLVHSGKNPSANHGAINPPVYHASTLLFPTVDKFLNRHTAEFRYGRRGTPTSKALENAIADLERAASVILTPSGKSANSTVLMAFAEPDSHYLVVDTTYKPTREFCTSQLAQMNVATTFYDPSIGANIADLIRPTTRLIWMESPGSQTFELQDVPAIAKVAKTRNIPTAIDNTWSGGFFFKPLEHGVDISVQSVTKYIGGHSDLMMGAICLGPRSVDLLQSCAGRFGLCTGPNDVYLALRGFRTLAVRMRQHHASGLAVAQWLAQHPLVERVMHPALGSGSSRSLWRRDFTGASGLFGFVMKELSQEKTATFLESLRYFGMGSSWGGYESLLIPTFPGSIRTATNWSTPGQCFRIHVGLENPNDLIADLEAAFDRIG
ncbi:MAG: cystathionine beta-lyase [Alphaproteobacteria bacterium]|nr:cystathionine beta-lyase [Alphaproteobacteria bacterium]